LFENTLIRIAHTIHPRLSKHHSSTGDQAALTASSRATTSLHFLALA
jgi:hypothetical protein